MPTVAKTSSTLAKLGDLSTYNVNTSAVPFDASDSSGSIPSFTATFVDGISQEYLVGETLTLSDPSISTYSGEVVSLSTAGTSNRYSVDTQSVLARLNSELRVYPLSEYVAVESEWIPIYSLEYWTQQCGIFYSKVPGDVLYFQSHYGHYSAFAKDITRPIWGRRSSEVGGVEAGSEYYDNRVWLSLGKGYTSTVTFPAPSSANPTGSYLPVLIPATGNGVAVFSTDLALRGSGRTSYVTWHFYTTTGKRVSVRLLCDSNNGFTLQTSETPGVYTTRVNVSVPNNAKYSATIGLSTPTSSTTTFVLNVHDASGNLIDSQTSTATTDLRGSLSMRIVNYTSVLSGSGAYMLIANTYVSQMSAMPLGLLPNQKSVLPGYKKSRFIVGFSGNVWENIKQYCSIYHLDISYEGGKLTIGARQKDVKSVINISDVRTTIQAREQARNVEVVNQQHEATGPTPKVMWQADTVYQVAVGEVQEFLVQTPHSILETSQPVCVSGITPFPYKSGAGQYVVTGSDGYIVSPTFWRDQGGSITTDITENDGEIKITIKGPDYDSPRAPYRISEGDAGRPALYVTGQGVLADPKTLKVSTGRSKAAKDVGVTIDSPFVSDAKIAFDCAFSAARALATPEMGSAITEPIDYDGVSELGTFPAGALFKHKGNVLRVTSASQSYSSLEGSATQHNTIYQLKRSFGVGATIGDMNDFYDGKTLGQVNIKPMKTVN